MPTLAMARVGALVSGIGSLRGGNSQRQTGNLRFSKMQTLVRNDMRPGRQSGK